MREPRGPGAEARSRVRAVPEKAAGDGSEARSGGSEGIGAAVEVARRRNAARRLRSVFDPEVGVSVVDLGLIYGVEVRGGEVTVTMTLTTAGCPLGDVLVGAVRRAVEALPWASRVRVAVVWDPPWHPGMIRPGAL